MMWERECQENATTGQVAMITATVNNNDYMTQTCIISVYMVGIGQCQLKSVQSDDTGHIQKISLILLSPNWLF